MCFSDMSAVRYVLAGTLFILVVSGNAPAGEQLGKAAKITIPPAPEMFSGEPQSLTPSQCGVCHPAVFRAVKEYGGRHRFLCQKCHDIAKSHPTGNVTGNAHKPRCASCHDRPHGQKVIRCAECHANPHTPKKLLAEAPIKRFCFECHGSILDKLAAFTSKHSKIACITCHTSHGLKPSCFTCHKPHQKGQALSTCVACHPAHMPRQVQYGKDLPSGTCGSCHAGVYAAWEKGLGKHQAIACVTCHKGRHRTIPACTDCHGKPHTPAHHERFPRCLTCHINVHNIPANPAKAKHKMPLQEK
jgi:predicted CXXCH cytochrome family protein